MIHYKGFVIWEEESWGRKTYYAGHNSHHAITSGSDLAKLLTRLDEKEGKL